MCEYCKQEVNELFETGMSEPDGSGAGCVVFLDTRHLCIQGGVMSEGRTATFKFPIKFCPKCGRDLWGDAR